MRLSSFHGMFTNQIRICIFQPDWSVIVSELDTQLNQLGASDYAGIMLLATVNDLRRRKYQIPNDIPKAVIKTMQKDLPAP